MVITWGLLQLSCQPVSHQTGGVSFERVYQVDLRQAVALDMPVAVKETACPAPAASREALRGWQLDDLPSWKELFGLRVIFHCHKQHRLNQGANGIQEAPGM